MQPLFLSCATVLLWCTMAAPLSAQQPEASAPLEKCRALIKAQQLAETEFSAAFNAAKNEEERQRVQKQFAAKASRDHYAGQFRQLIEDHPKDAAALEAFQWLLSRVPHHRETVRAAMSVIANWIEDERLGEVCEALFYRSCPAGDTVLRKAIDTSPHPAVQGRACYALARSLVARADGMVHGRPQDREPVEREAKALLQQVIDRREQLKDLPDLVKASEGELFVLEHLAIGKTAPDIEGEDMEGKKMKLSDFRGKVVLIDFWATWCGPCMAAVEHERLLVKRVEGKAFAIVGINGDRDAQVAQRVCVEKGMTWRSFWDGGSSSGPIATRWNVQVWPTKYLIDSEGVVRYKGDYLRSSSVRIGKDGKPEQFQFLDEAVDALLNELKKKER